MKYTVTFKKGCVNWHSKYMSICSSSVRKYFDIPSNVEEIYLTVTDRPSKDAYMISKATKLGRITFYGDINSKGEYCATTQAITPYALDTYWDKRLPYNKEVYLSCKYKV